MEAGILDTVKRLYSGHHKEMTAIKDVRYKHDLLSEHRGYCGVLYQWYLIF